VSDDVPGETLETLEERVAAVVADLSGASREAAGEATVLAVAGRTFAVVAPGVVEAWLDPAVATAALATPDTRASARGAGWIRFSPVEIDRFALDRAEAWLRSAHRRAGAAPRGN
jgi:hypothetical protein